MVKREWVVTLPLIALGIGVTSSLISKPVVVNGLKSANGAIVQDGVTYISAEALKQGGAQVSSTDAQVTVNFLPLDGRNQVDAVEGKLEEWIQNEVWRMRVVSVETGTNPFGRGPGFAAKVEFRNLGKSAISPFQSGLDKIQVIDSKGQVLAFNQGTFKHFFRDVAPGGQITETIQFGDQSNVISAVGEPEKLIAFFRKSGGKKSKDLRVFLK